MAPKSLACLLLCLYIYLPCLSQSTESVTEKITNFPEKFFSKINANTTSLASRLDRQTAKYLQRMLKKEKKLRRRLARRDSAAASELFADVEKEYAVTPYIAFSGRSRSTEYSAHLDTLNTSLSFLELNGENISFPKESLNKVQGTLKHLNGLQTKFRQSEQVKAFISRRRELIRQTLSRYTRLPKSISRTYNNVTRDVYYYSQQVREYKEMLNNPDRLVKKALSEIARLNIFQQFMREHSQFAGLFRIPSNSSIMPSLVGLQTRSQVQQVLQNQLAAAGPNAQQVVQQNLHSAQQQLSVLKEKINKFGNNGSDGDMPDFKPNSQRTKSFLHRLEVGTNIQSANSNTFFPVTTDLGLSLGYKLNDNSVIGIGGSYKIGWGKDIRNIKITSEGLGLRSFLEIKLKGSFFASGGFEYNYQDFITPSTAISGWGGRWTKSGLAGISKVISMKTKFFRKTKLQLLWDFLSYQQQPQTQALKFRVGYNF
jgi:hypothetical protein